MTAKRRSARRGAFVAALLAAGCSGASTGPPAGGPGGEEPAFDALFAPPTPGEIAAVRAEWASRSTAAIDATVEAVIPTTFGTMSGEATVISHRVDGSRHFGALFVPDGAPSDAPVVVYLHGGENVAIPRADTDFLFGGVGASRDQVVYLIPSFRSERLEVAGQSYRSGGSASPWDRDVDDALALVRAAVALAPGQVDADRIVAIGVSRGALVALLMAVRDPGIDGVVEISGPTDFFDASIRGSLEQLAEGDAAAAVGLSYLDANYLQPWLGGELSTADFRRELVRRSAVLFAEDLPSVQVHHGTNDPVVAPSHAQSLISTMTDLSRASPEFEAFLYAGGTHLLTSLTAAPDRAGALLDNLVMPQGADLGVVRSGPSQATVGDTITVVISTGNKGPVAATSISVSDTLPGGVRFIAASRGAVETGGVVRWPALATLASGAAREDTLLLEALVSGAQTGVAAVTSATTDPDPSDNRSSLTTNVAAAGPDLNALFANPTAAELTAVRAEWSSRNPAAINPVAVKTLQVTASGVTGQLRAIRHTVDGLAHYGSVFVPNGLQAGSAPIIVFLHPGEGGVNTPGRDLDLAVATLKNLSRDFVYVFPSFRGEPLRFGNDTYASGGARDFWDRDVDDALALMEVVRSSVPEADPSRIAAFGASRGALVALLMGARDPRIDGVISLMAPTDFYEPWLRGLLSDLVNGKPAQGDFEDFLNRTILQPWAAGQLSLADARSELIRRSAVYFAGSLPWTQIHHGEADPVVSVQQAYSLIGRMAGRSPPAFEAFLYPGAGHSVSQLTGSTARIRTFVETLWP